MEARSALDVVKHHPQQRQVDAVTRFWRRIWAFLEYLVGPCSVCGALGSLDGDEGDGLDGLCLQCGTRSGETSTPGEAEWMRDGARGAIVDPYALIFSAAPMRSAAFR
jgi:hypothetical protein